MTMLIGLLSHQTENDVKLLGQGMAHGQGRPEDLYKEYDLIFTLAIHAWAKLS